MKRVFNASNASDAYLLRDLLEQVGIATYLSNTYAMAAVGEIPVGTGYPQIWVLRDELEERARKIIDDYLSTSTSGAERRCLKCDEKSPATFDFCWQCNTALPMETQ